MIIFFTVVIAQLLKEWPQVQPFKEISGAGMKSVPVVNPDNKIIKQFNDFCNPFFQQQKILESENIRLSNARDVLLPKLMTGEIDVSDLEL